MSANAKGKHVKPTKQGLRDLRDLTRALAESKRQARDWWRAWAERACADLGALLAETIRMREPESEEIAAARNLLIAAERELAEITGRS